MKIIAPFLMFCMLVNQGYAQRLSKPEFPDTIVNRHLTRVIVAESLIYTGGLIFLGTVWYKDRERIPFHFFNDNDGYLQIDKCGHTYSAYHESRFAYRALRRSGVSRERALLFGGSMGLLFQAPIEIFDGLYEGHGFSWGDMAANTLGSAMFVAQEAFFDEQIITPKFSYSPSGYPKYYDKLGTAPLESLFLDYNAHTYWLSGNIRKISGKKCFPAWLNLAFGYSANGMLGEFENVTFYKGKPIPHFNRYRQFLLSPDIDFSRLPARSRFLRAVFHSLNMFKIPFPAIELNSKGQLKLHPLYF